MKQKLVLDWIPTDLNTYINKERTNKFIASKIKREETENVYWSCKEQSLQEMVHPVLVKCDWYVTSKRKDPDNTSFALKFILDGIVKAGVLKNDGFNNIYRIEHSFFAGTEEKVEIELIEAT